jgi:serine protease inhibitor
MNYTPTHRSYDQDLLTRTPRLPRMRRNCSPRHFAAVCSAALVAVVCARSARPGGLPTSPGRAAPFALDVLDRTAAGAPGQNVAISPISLVNALAVTARAAEGQTAREFDQLLQLPLHDSPQVVADELRTVSRAGQGALLVRNALWMPASLAINSSFTPAPFDARVARLPKSGPEASGAINAWVDDATDGAIKKLVDSSIDTRGFVVTSVAYFKGKWVRPFDASATKLQDFLVRGGTPYKVPMMHQPGISVRYWSSGDLEAVRLPFEGGTLEYVIVTSRSRAPADEILRLIREHDLGDRLCTGVGFESRYGAVEIPRHHVEFGVELSETLKRLGLRLAYTSAADFSALSRTPLRLRSTQHRVALVVDETGAVATGATAMEFTLGSGLHRPPRLNFIADRPFVSFLVNRHSPKWPAMIALIRSP